jgi:predicted P-loop ATPase
VVARPIPDDLKEVAQEYDKKITVLAKKDSWQNLLKMNSDGGVKTRSVYNIQLFINHDELFKDLIAYDEFADQIIKIADIPTLKIKKGFWTDSDDAILRVYLESRYNLLFGKDNITDAVVSISREKTVNPVKERIESVKWDGKPRAANYFIDYLGAENNHYTKAVTKVWLTGLIARVYNPGCKFEIVPILEGKQGLGKSTAASILYPDKFNDTIDSLGKQKDDYQQLQGSWILEIAELSAMKKTDVEKVKNFISAQVDNYRNSYGRYSIPHPRKCVFIGTTNQTDYLKDATGERRFYPIKCGVNKPAKNVWKPDHQDILQILAEAKTWFDNKSPLYLDKETMQEAKKYQAAAETVDPMKDAIEDFLNMEVPTNWADLSSSDKQAYFRYRGANLSDWLNNKLSSEREPLKQTTTREIMEVVFNKTVDKYLMGRTNSEAKKIKLIMDNMNKWSSQRIRINGKRVRGYMREIE